MTREIDNQARGDFEKPSEAPTHDDTEKAKTEGSSVEPESSSCTLSESVVARSEETRIQIEVDLQPGATLDEPPTPLAASRTPRSTSAGSPEAGRFQVNEVLGRGGQGEVWKAIDPELDREVALKVIKPGLKGSQPTLTQFQREAEMTGKLEHPNIIPIYEAGKATSDGSPYYVMRILREHSLQVAIDTFHRSLMDSASECRNRSSRSDTQTEHYTKGLRELLNRFVDICDALAYAHSRGVIHRDLKPANVMLGEFGETLVVDWGLATVVNRANSDNTTGMGRVRLSPVDDPEKTQTGTAIGTPTYMSPEQAAGKIRELGPATDIYTLGAILFCILTGQAPIGARPKTSSVSTSGPQSSNQNWLSVLQVVEHAKQGRFPKPRLIQPLVPPALEAVCLKAMSLRPEDRYQSATDLRAEAQRWLSDEPVSAWREPFTVRARRWIRRHQTMVVSTSAVIIVAALSLSVLSVVVTGKNRDLKTANDAERTARGQAEANEQRAIEGETLARQNERRAIDGETLARKNEQRAIEGEQKAEAARLVAEQNEQLAVRRAEETRRSLYFSSIALADAMRRRNQSRQAEETLDRCPPDLRNWEWHYLRRQCDHSIRTMDQQAAVSSVAVSPDGSLIASAAGGVYIGVSRDSGCVHIWDAATGQRLRTIKVTAGSVSSVAFHPGGNTIVTACTKGIVAVWTISNGTLVREIGRHTGIAHSAVFDSKGERILSGGADGAAKLWNSETGELIHEFAHDSAVKDVALSHSGLKAATASSKAYRLWDIQSGKLDRELPTTDGGSNWTFHAFPSVCFMERDSVAPTLVTPQENATHDVGYWNTGNSMALPWRGHTESVLDVASHPGHKRVGSVSWDLTVRIWSPRGVPERILLGHDDAIHCVAWSPSGEQVVSGSRDGTIKIWNALVDPEAMQLSKKSVEGLTLSPDGQWVGGNFTDSISVWSLETGSEVLKVPKKDRFTVDKPLSPTCKVHVLPGSRGVVVLDKQNAHLLSLETGETLHTWEVFKRDPGNATEWQSALSSDGQQLAVFSKWEGISVWGVSRLTMRPTKRIPAVGLPAMIRFDPDNEGRLTAFAGVVGILRADIHSGEITRQAIDGLGASVASAALSSDGRLLAITPSSRNKNGSHGATEIDLFDVSKRQFLRTLKGHQYVVRSLEFLPDGSRLISGSWDRTIKIWDVATGSDALTLTDMTEGATELVVSPDGSQIVSSADSLRVWNGARIEVAVPAQPPTAEKPEPQETQKVTIQKAEPYEVPEIPLEKLMTFFKPPELAGKPAPDFTLSSLNGEKFKLADQKGQIVVLVFWTTWYGPCLDALTVVDRVVRELDDKEVQLVAVNVMEDAEKIRSLLEKKNLNLTVVLDSDRKVSQLYHANGLPQTVIVGSDGNVHSNFSGVPPEENIRSAIAETSRNKTK